MYQNMRVPVITGGFITDEDKCKVLEIKKDGEVVIPVYIDSKTDETKFGVLIEYGNYLYIENKPNSGYDIHISFETPDTLVKIIAQRTNYSIKIICKAFLVIKNVSTEETAL